MVDYSKFDGIGGSDEEEEENATSYEQLLEVEGIRTMGNGAVEKGDHARAVRLYRDALRKQPFPVGERGVELARTLRLNLATALLQLGDLGEAEKAAGVVLLKEPRDHHALRLRGTVRLKKGCHEEGIRDLKLALKTARNAEEREEVKCILLDNEEGASSSSLTVRAEGALECARRMRGSGKLREANDAVLEAQRSLTVLDQRGDANSLLHGKVLDVLSDIQAREGKFSEAEATAWKAFEVLAALSGGECDKLAAVTLVSLGMLAVRRGSPKEAMEVWSRAVSHVAGCEVSDVDSWTPNDVQCATLVASVLMKMGRLSQEMEHVRRAAVLLSRTARDQKSSLEGGGERVLEGEVEAWTTLADLAEQEGDHHEAVRALRRLKLIQDQRDDRNGQEGLRDRSVLLRRLSLALGRTGESSEAIEHIRGAISALEQLVSNHEGWQSEMADLWRSLALLENSRGRLPEALEALQIAKKLHWDEAQDLAIETRIKLAHGGQLNLETNHINQ